MLNLVYFSIFAFLISYVLNKFYLKNLKYLSIRKNQIQSNNRWGDSFKSHFGGVSFSVCAILISLFLISQNITEIRGISIELKSFVGIFFVVLVSTVVGIIDESETLGPWSKIFNQLIICAILIWAGFVINFTNYFLINIFISIAWLLLVINAFNLFDNVDLALSTYALAILIFLLFFSMNIVYSSMLQIIMSAYIGAIIGFICFNYFPSKIFMGEIGSLQLGTVISALSISILWNDYQPQNILSSIYFLLLNNVLFIVLFLDIAFVFLYRWSLGRSILRGDTNHISHRFLKLGYSPNTYALLILLINIMSFSVFSFLVYFVEYFEFSLRFSIILMYYTIVMLILLKIYMYKK